MSHRRIAAVTVLVLLALLAVGCGDEEEADPNAIVCDASQKIKTLGGVGEVDGAFAGATLEGELTPRRISLGMGEVDYLPQGATEPDRRARLLVFQTNLADPGGRELLINIERRISEVGEDGRTFQIVNRDLTTYCDVQAGELCARFGLDDSANGELVEDNVIHPGVGGSITFTALSATRLAAEWDVDLGANLQNEFDTSSGDLRGCFDAVKGAGLGENVFPLE